jgi:alanine dehydrogenase
MIGIPKESPWIKGAVEKRVGLSPAGVAELVDRGATVVVQRGAGEGAGFSDEEYEQSGAQLVMSTEEAYRRARVICKVERPPEGEWDYLQSGHILLGFLHLATAPKAFLKRLVEAKVTAIGYEIIQEPSGRLPVLGLTSEIAGKMTPQLAGRLLERGRGILLGGIPSVPPADVVILGGGTLGYHAARALLGVGASVYILEKDLQRASELDQLLDGRVVVAMSTRHNLERFVPFADVLIGAVLQPGERTPTLVTREMIRAMNEGAVFIDFSIDQGGCSETSRPTLTEADIYIEEGVIHFCMPNVSSLVARTATDALTNAALPYIEALLAGDLRSSVAQRPELARGVYTHGGAAVHPSLAGQSGLPYRELDELLSRGEGG